MVLLLFERAGDFTWWFGSDQFMVGGILLHSAPFRVVKSLDSALQRIGEEEGRLGMVIQASKDLNCLCVYSGLSIALCQHREIGFIGQMLQLNARSWMHLSGKILQVPFLVTAHHYTSLSISFCSFCGTCTRQRKMPHM